MTKHFYLFVVTFAILVTVGCRRVSTTSGPVAAGPVGPKIERNHPPQDLPEVINFSKQSVVRGDVVPSIIDTRNFKKQIYRTEPFRGRQLSSDIFRPVKNGEPGLIHGPPNDLLPGSLTGQRRIAPQQLFPGISASPWTPPDPTIAVGPNHIVQTVNMELAFFGKDGTPEFQQRLDSTGNPGFFEELGSGDFCFDPKCFFDHYSQRFIVLALEVYGDTESWITFAISDDDDPHGVWYKYRTWSVVTYDGDTTYWCDYPGLGFDANGFYVTNNLFKLDGPGPGFGGALFRVFDKIPLLNGQPVTFNDIAEQNAASVQVAQHFGSNAAPYFVSRGSSTQIRVDAMNDPFGAPSLSTHFVGVPQGFNPPQAETPTGTLSIVGSRIMNVHWRDGGLWTCHAVESDDGNRAVAQWYEIDTGQWPVVGSPPSLVQSGEVDMGSPFHTFFPAIYTNTNGSAAMVFGKSSTSENPSVYATGRLVNDPLGTMGFPEQFIISPASATGRWGDYFDVALDPTDGRTFWMVGEYRESDGWRTTINSFVLPEPEDITAVSLNVITGSLESGSVTEIQQSDDQYAVLDPVFQAARYQLIFTVNGISFTENPTEMEFGLESKTLNFVGTVDQTIELFNYTTGQFEVVDTGSAGIFESVTQVTINGDLSRFVENGMGSIQARITYQNAVPFWVFSIVNAYLPFETSVDHVFWTITP